MIDVVAIGSRFIGDVFRSFRSSRTISPVTSDPKSGHKSPTGASPEAIDELAARALTTVFGMDGEGRIKKEKARRVVQNLGLIGEGEDGENVDFDLSEEDQEVMRAEEIVRGMEKEDGEKREELLRQAFTVFDEDGDGFIEAVEVKKVLECLGLANGWEMEEFKKMVEVVDLNFDGKVDFGEFELMMMGEKRLEGEVWSRS